MKCEYLTQFIEHCTESEKQGGCVGTEWFSVYGLLSLVILRLTGSRSSLRSITREDPTHITACEKIKIQSMLSTECVLLLHHRKLNHCKLGTDGTVTLPYTQLHFDSFSCPRLTGV